MASQPTHKRIWYPENVRNIFGTEGVIADILSPPHTLLPNVAKNQPGGILLGLSPTHTAGTRLSRQPRHLSLELPAPG
ncbi:MAG: hypothetical protein C7B43_10225 [Sulfobacillus benefaciens]|uniref:Uncharacterized protein n=1 Tax=Sulfobacillus benefaciens TaxID=453960 RepID=A0A2T2X1J3_9FIRM|nr:MAG: hypothetical protein C7B43_10225 [Sulfobacillus benefaciens]